MRRTRRNRTTVVLAAFVLSAVVGIGLHTGCAAGQATQATTGNPALGKWDFNGKDDSGVVWNGQLTIGKLEVAQIDRKTYFASCTLEVQAPGKGMRSVGAPCQYDSKTRALSFATRVGTARRYTAVLARDGKSLTNGKWTEGNGVDVVASGEWSAKLR